MDSLNSLRSLDSLNSLGTLWPLDSLNSLGTLWPAVIGLEVCPFRCFGAGLGSTTERPLDEIASERDTDGGNYGSTSTAGEEVAAVRLLCGLSSLGSSGMGRPW